MWRSGKANPRFRIPTETAIRHLGPIDADPDAPGPLASANEDTTIAILAAAGWEDASADPLHDTLETHETAMEAVASIGSMGAATRIMDTIGAAAARRAAIAADIAEGFRQFETHDGLSVPVTMTLLSARATKSAGDVDRSGA